MRNYEIMVAYSLYGVDRNSRLSQHEGTQIDRLCERRLARIPVQYVIGEWDFLSLTLNMRPPVFIPRPETEELVTLVHKSLTEKGKTTTPTTILDVGTGSGAIAIALLDLLPEARAIAVDATAEACCLATENAQMTGVDNRLRVFNTALGNNQNDWIKLTESYGEFDVIVSNPPYIPSGNVDDLEPEITRFEDHGALFSGEDGMAFIRLILKHTSQLLKPSGSLWLEVDLSHPKEIRSYVHEHDVGLEYLRAHLDFTNRERFCHLVTSS